MWLREGEEPQLFGKVCESKSGSTFWWGKGENPGNPLKFPSWMSPLLLDELSIVTELKLVDSEDLSMKEMLTELADSSWSSLLLPETENAESWNPLRPSYWEKSVQRDDSSLWPSASGRQVSVESMIEILGKTCLESRSETWEHYRSMESAEMTHSTSWPLKAMKAHWDLSHQSPSLDNLGKRCQPAGLWGWMCKQFISFAMLTSRKTYHWKASKIVRKRENLTQRWC